MSRIRYFNYPVMSLEEVGKVLGISRERVAVLEKKALAKLRINHFSALSEMLDHFDEDNSIDNSIYANLLFTNFDTRRKK